MKSDKVFIIIRILTVLTFYLTAKLILGLSTFVFYYIENRNIADLLVIDTIIFAIYKFLVISLILLKISLSKKAVLTNIKKFKRML